MSETESPECITETTQTIIIGPLDERIKEWLKWDENPVTYAEIETLNTQGNMEKLMELLMDRLQFGTAGLRGRMGPGYTQMNDLVIIQTTQGIVKYLLQTEEEKEAVCKAGVAIGYDGRYSSKRFAQLTATVFLSNDIPVYLFSEIVPTPFVPFCVTTKKCAAGIMITASHNPKEDNGYKVYWANGAQIIPPHDKLIQKMILENLEPWGKSWDTSILKTSPLISDPIVLVTANYMAAVRDSLLDMDMNIASHVKITYTAMHGVGYKFMKAAFKCAGFKPFMEVANQILPDPDFPTVKFPNPEEGESALDLAISRANETNSTVILANDPDADRLAVAEKMSEVSWHIFSGNELGALLGWWAMHTYRKKNPDADLSNVYMLASTVSSKFLKTMARQEGFNFVETLTGFKWMGNTACDLIAKGHVVLFAFEEAIGFMCGTAVLDKDGISAGVRTAELLAYLATKNLTLDLKLAQLYETYGYHLTNNSYFHCSEPAVLKKLFERLRNFEEKPGEYPAMLKNGKFKVLGVRDLTTGYDSTTPDGKAALPSSASSQMITFTLDHGLTATLRTSGTEPKVKYYTEVISVDGNANLHRLKKLLAEMCKALTEEFLQPAANGLRPKSQ